MWSWVPWITSRGLGGSFGRESAGSKPSDTNMATAQHSQGAAAQAAAR